MEIDEPYGKKLILVSPRDRIDPSSYFSLFLNHKTMENDLMSVSTRVVETHKKRSRNQRNWNVEQLNMQRNWFLFLLQLQLQKYHMHGINWCMIAVVLVQFQKK